MRLGNWNLWTLLAATAAMASGLNGCSSMKPFEDIGCAGGGFLPEIKWRIRILPPGGRTGDIDGDDAYANRCAEIRWFDENGKEISADSIQLDDHGDGSISVPNEATQMKLAVTKCPESSGSAQSFFPILETLGDSSSATPGATSTSTAPQAHDLGRFVVLSSPLGAPDHTPGATELAYVMNVFAENFDQAFLKTAATAGRGVGAPIPADVQVVEFIEITQGLSSIELRSSLPTPFQQFEVIVNQGLHKAELGSGSNVALSSQGSWSSCATEIPLRAFRTTSSGNEKRINEIVLRSSGSSAETRDLVHVMKSVGI